MLAEHIALLVSAAMLSGMITGIEIIEALQINIKAAEDGNRAVLEISPEGIDVAMAVVYGETKGNA